MNIYKITNISENVGKRDPNYKSILTLKYVNNLKEEKLLIKPGETVYLSINKLPISAHSLRVKNLISVSEISESELKKVLLNKKEIKKQVPLKSSALLKTEKKITVKTKTATKTTAKKTTKKGTKKTDEGYFNHTIKE